MARSLYGTMIVIYYCSVCCGMCDCFKCPTKSKEEITSDVVGKLSEMAFTNIAGGEPFIRRDIPGIVKEPYKKSGRIVISANGHFTNRITDLCREFPKVRIYISIEGLQKTNDRIHGIPDGFSRGCRTLTAPAGMGYLNVRFGVAVQDMSCENLIPLYCPSDQMGMEFATAALHNSSYFRKNDNHVEDKEKVAEHFEQLICGLLKSSLPRKWFQAYSNHGLISYIYGNPHLLACDMFGSAFFIGPFCDVIPCSGMCQKAVIGDLGEQEWEEL